MQALWRGELPLARAFWEYLVLYGLLASLASTGGALLSLLAGAPGPVALAIHLLPTPYMLVATVGVDRSARRHPGSPVWAQAARVAAAPWAILTIVL
jgi:hypothetical protein